MFKSFIIGIFLIIFFFTDFYFAEAQNSSIKPDSLQPKQILSPEMMMNFKRISEVKLSPKGDRLIYNFAVPSLIDNKVYKDIYTMNIDGSDIRRLAEDPSNEFGAIWSPDASVIDYISTIDGEPQIYETDISGRHMVKITNGNKGVSNLGISPDGRWISYTSDVKIKPPAKDEYQALPKANARIYQRIPIREWDDWEDESYSHIFVIPAESGKPVDIMPGEPYDTPLAPFGGAEQIAWSPDSKEIAYTGKKVDFPATSTNSDIYIFSIKNGSTKNITKDLPSYDKDPLYSPDGMWIAFHSQQRPGFESDRVRLMLYNRKTEEIIELSRTLDQWVGEMIWSPDSKYIYFSAEDGPTVQIYSIEVPSGNWKVITKGQYNYEGSLNISPDGKTLYFERRSMVQPAEIFSMPAIGGEVKQISHFNDEILAGLKPIKIEQKFIPSIDGKRIHTWVIYPPDFDPKKKYPMMTYCQGGPQSTISQYWSYRWNFYLLASQGYVVVAPNRRGVPGFGQEWNDAISKDWGGMPMKDILSATDYMSKENYIDPKRMCAVGASAGGYAVYWLEGNHNKRFSAFMAHAGVFDLVSEYGSTEELFFSNWENGGPYWEEKYKSYYKNNSPSEFSQNWDTPIFISAGEKDFRVPFTQALEAFTVAQLKGLPSKIMLFPEENHWVLKPQNVVLWWKEQFDFLDKYCKSKK